VSAKQHLTHADWGQWVYLGEGKKGSHGPGPQLRTLNPLVYAVRLFWAAKCYSTFSKTAIFFIPVKEQGQINCCDLNLLSINRLHKGRTENCKGYPSIWLRIG
jgi:hypothetical protein